MASRLARSAIGVTRLRPSSSVGTHTIPSLSSTSITAPSTSFQTRHASNVPVEDPKKKAQSLLDSLPGNSLVSKAAILSSGAGLSIFGISNEFLVINEETVVAFCLLSVFWGVGKYGGPMYAEWAQGQVEKIKGILNTARADHTKAVQQRIENVKQLGSVVDVTKDLFAVSKETVELEAKAYELEQRTALVQEARTVLDSWVRYEGQVKTRQQKELAESIINKITKELENPKILQQILNQSVADVERIISSKA
ncbi:atp4 subunit B of the stator stalk of mitochondrial F1F0 ATP synthase [Agyrium rufum]|nr:atp4 subunit B of the stator stalk of mitochondrial F1F0 ATP synthase [Agyrium rufum]